MKLTKLLSFTALSALFIASLTSCDTVSTNTEPGDGTVKLQFKTVSGSTSSSALLSNNTLSFNSDMLLMEDANGALQIDDIRFIVAEFELDPFDADGDTTELEEFESKPFFVDLPLAEATLSLANSQIQAGFYEELEFEVENLDFEDLDEEDEDRLVLGNSIRTEFSDWPDQASMVIIGTYTPAGGEAQSFKVYAEAEIEVEREFNPPLEVTEDNISQAVSVQINPTKWFVKSDGSVIDLSQYDWDEYQQLLEFEAEFEDGIEKIEAEDDDDDDDDGDDD